jgi:hypothetical protein
MSDPEPADPVHMLASMGTMTAFLITMIGIMIIGLVPRPACRLLRGKGVSDDLFDHRNLIICQL